MGTLIGKLPLIVAEAVIYGVVAGIAMTTTEKVLKEKQ